MASHATSAPSGRTTFRGLTFSIRQLLLGTAFVALACLALRGASAWWVSTSFGLAVAALAIGALMAIYRSGSQRAFWVGFVLCGGVHLALVLYGWHLMSSENVGNNHPLRARANRQTLPTARASAWAHDWIFTRRELATDVTGFSGAYGGGYGVESGYSMPDGGYVMPGGYGGMPGGVGPGFGGGMPVADDPFGDTPGSSSATGPPLAPPREPPALADFINVGHSLWTLVLAAAGGWIALLIHATDQRPQSQEAAP